MNIRNKTGTLYTQLMVLNNRNVHILTLLLLNVKELYSFKTRKVDSFFNKYNAPICLKSKNAVF
jgi:hypothetical protein